MIFSERLRRAPWSLPILAAALTAVGVATIATAAEGHRVPYAWLQTRWAAVGLAARALRARPRRAVGAGAL
jgi:hypothetical protein